MKRRSYFEWVRIGFAIHVGVLVLLFGGLFGFIVFQSYLRQWRYEPVQATILKSVAEPCEDGMFTPDIQFAYTVDRRRYTGGKYRDDFGRVCLREPEVEEILQRYPQGAVIDVWYDPKNPKLAVIDRSMGWLHYGFLIVLGGFVVMVGLPIWLFKRSRRGSNEAVNRKTN